MHICIGFTMCIPLFYNINNDYHKAKIRVVDSALGKLFRLHMQLKSHFAGVFNSSHSCIA